jgi:hypothetical protein
LTTIAPLSSCANKPSLRAAIQSFQISIFFL